VVVVGLEKPEGLAEELAVRKKKKFAEMKGEM
jgi:hypothetical protein